MLIQSNVNRQVHYPTEKSKSPYSVFARAMKLCIFLQSKDSRASTPNGIRQTTSPKVRPRRHRDNNVISLDSVPARSSLLGSRTHYTTKGEVLFAKSITNGSGLCRTIPTAGGGILIRHGTSNHTLQRIPSNVN